MKDAAPEDLARALLQPLNRAKRKRDEEGDHGDDVD